MSRHWKRGVLVLAGALCALALGRAEAETQGQSQPKAESQPKGGAAHAKAPVKEEQAMSALKDMCTTLASAKTLRFKIRNLVPMKAPSGDWITLVGTASVMRQGNDKLFAETGGDLYAFRFYYDGKTVTAFSPEAKVYARKDAPHTIDAMLDRAAKNGEATFVFADLVSADPYTAMTQGLQSAFVVGTSTVDGVETRHLAVHGKAIDWEIWIGTNDRLPRLVTLTDVGDARKPTQTIQLSDWAVDESLPADTFSFAKPDDAKEVPFRSPAQAAAAARRTPTAKRP